MKAPLRTAAVLLISFAMLGCASDHKGRDRQDAQPADPSNVQAAHTFEVPPDDPLAHSLRDQVERNWNLGSLAGSPDLAGMVVQLRLELLPDGTVDKLEIEHDQPGNATFRQVAEGAIRAVKLSSPLKLPPGIHYKVIHLRFHPDQVVQ